MDAEIVTEPRADAETLLHTFRSACKPRSEFEYSARAALETSRAGSSRRLSPRARAQFVVRSRTAAGGVTSAPPTSNAPMSGAAPEKPSLIPGNRIAPSIAGLAGRRV